MEDSIKQVVKDVKYLVATDCSDETIQARIENFIKERKDVEPMCEGCPYEDGPHN